MSNADAINALVQGYATYAAPTDISVDAVSPAPAASTSPVCVVSIASSWKCAAASGAGLATLTTGC